MRKFYVIGMIAAACLVVAAQAWAGSAITAAFFQNGANAFTATGREYLVDNVFTNKGQIDVGDAFRGEFNLTTFNSGGGANIGGTSGIDELTAVFQVKVVNKTSLGPIFFYTLTSDPAFVAPGGLCPTCAVGTVAALYTGPVNYIGNFTDPGAPAGPDDGTAARTVAPSSADVSGGPYNTEQQFLNNAKDGAFFAALGISNPLDPAQGIAGLTVGGALKDNVLTAFALTSGSSGALFNLGLNVLQYGPAFPALVQIKRTTVSPFDPDPLNPTLFVDVAIAEAIGGVKDLDTPFEISSLFPGSFNAQVVPEPTALLLFGGGLLSLAILVHRRKKA